MDGAAADPATAEVVEKDHSESWVEVEKMLAACKPSAESERWKSQSIFRVPKWIMDMTNNSKAYQPQLVSLGPFHHHDTNLLPMEEHKRRALVHLVNRSGKKLQDVIAAVDGVVEELQAAYGKDLGDEWRGENKHRFVQVMVTDGCFLLELVLMGNDLKDYESHDPVFGDHGKLYIWPVIQSDMLLMENQLPLLLLHSLAVQLEIPRAPWNFEHGPDINQWVLNFQKRSLQNVLPLGLHPLHIYHASFVYDNMEHKCKKQCEYQYEIMPSAVEIHEAGIHFMTTETDRIVDISFKDSVLRMPAVTVDDSTECLLLNLMAFERLHVGAGNLMTAYVVFMDNIINSAKDVALLSSKGVLRNMLGSHEETAKLFNTLSRGAILGRCTQLHAVQCDVSTYCKKPWNKWRFHIIHTYFRKPWAFISLVAGTLLLTATLLQTVYTIVPFYQHKP